MLLTANAEGGVQGATVGTGEAGSGDPWDSIVGTPLITYDDEHAHGTRAYRVTLSGTTTAQQLVWGSSVGTVTEMWGRLYLWSAAHPADNRFGLIRMMNGGSQAARLIYQVDGTLQLSDAGNGPEITTSATVATGQWVRIEWRVQFVAVGAAVEIRLYNDAESTVATEVVSGTAIGIGAACDSVQVGAFLNALPCTWDGWLDDIEINDTGFPGPVPPPPAPSFPETPLDIRLELGLPSGWADITADALTRDPITITRGRADEASTADPARLKTSLKDPDGRYSSRNPLSPLFGDIGRNTPLRARVGDAAPYAYLPGVEFHYISTPDTAALDVTGDLDIRIEITPDSWRPDQTTILASKYLSSGGQRSWVLELTSAGALQLRPSSDGLVPTQIGTSTVPVPADAGRLALRAVYDVDNGAGNRQWLFYTAPSIDGPWTQLGAAVVGTGVGSVFAGTANLVIGADSEGDFLAATRVFHGAVHAFQVRNGIGGPIVANPGLEQEAGTTAWTGTDGLPWTAHGQARFIRPARFHGEVSSWPPRWHKSGHDRHVPITASGISRRLRQGAAPLQSPLRRSIPESAGLVAYWPMEDGEAATQAASALPGGTPLTIRAPGIQWASSSVFVGSNALPVMGAGQLVGTPGAYTAAGQAQLRFLVHVPEPMAASRLLVQFTTTGTARRWDLWYDAEFDSVNFSVYDADDTLIFSHEVGLGFILSRFMRVTLDLTQAGGNINWEMWILGQDLEGATGTTGTINGRTIGIANRIVVGDHRGLGDTVIGHVTFGTQVLPVFDVGDEFTAFAGENGGERLVRLGTENGIPVQIVGQLSAMPAMGLQSIAPLPELLDEIAEADGGILTDARDELGLLYRSRASMYNQSARVALDYAQPGLAPPLEPSEDDQGTRNDITAERTGGSSARAVAESGPLSVQPPPLGVGRYAENVTVNVATDRQLPHQAGWRRHLGTWDEARFPSVAMWLHRQPDLIPGASAMEVGDRVTVANPPAGLPPEPINVLAQGYTELLLPHRWELTLNASPAGPWETAVLDDPVRARLGSSGSSLAAPVDADDTALSVAVVRLLWTVDSAAFPFDVIIGGERLTVTAISGASSPQTWTVIRAVNGISKPHQAGAAVRLAQPMILAL